MTTKFKGALWAATALLFVPAGTAFGSVITFASLTGSNGDAFSSYSEAGFTATSTAGAWCKAFVYGNPVPDLFAGASCAGAAPDTLAVTMSGGQFTFVGFDMSSNLGATAFSIVGKNGASTVFTQNGSQGSTNPNFVTIASTNAAAVITELDITFSGVVGVAPPSSYNIDNISLNAAAVPEPSFFPILLGLAGVGGFALKRRAK